MSKQQLANSQENTTMTDRPATNTPELSDEELLELLKNHGIDRRTVLKLLGFGTALSVGTGNAAAKHNEQHPSEIDPNYGYATPDASDVPDRLEPDHVVELHIIPPSENQPPLFHFSPSGLSVDAGDIVQFTFTAPDHTVTAYHPAHGFQRRVPQQSPPFSSPVVSAGGAWLYRFECEGLYDMYCGPHHVLGMAMRVVVGELDEIPDYEDTFEGSAGPPPLLAPFSKAFLENELHSFTAFVDGDNENCEWVWLTPKEVLDTAALDPENIQDEGSVPFNAVLDDIERADIEHGHE